MRVSRPGRRRYAGVGEMRPIRGGMGIAIVSTSQGLVSDKQARERGIGGEVMAVVW
jgi:small subunit ribosomal protein S8